MLGEAAADRLFVENRGQIGDQLGRPNRDVRFLVARPGLNIQLRSRGFSYDSYVVDRCDVPTTDVRRSHPGVDLARQRDGLAYHVHRVDVELIGANPAPTIVASEESADYLNYYNHVTAQHAGDLGVTGVRGFGRVRYHDVWPGIDLEWFLNDRGDPEYQFMVDPGAQPSLIQLRYHGSWSADVLATSVIIHVMHGPIIETLPRSYLAKSGATVEVRYRQLDSNTVGVDMDADVIASASIDTLVIDPAPEWLWGTYYGGAGNDVGAGVVALDDDQVVLLGSTEALNAIATSGAHQQSFAGSQDVFLAKLWQWQRGNVASPVRRWGTYYGGNSIEWSTAIARVGEEHVVITGFTRSVSGIATGSAHQVTPGGELDAFVALFDSSGRRTWSSYLGGEREDDGNAVSVSGNGVIAVIGSTASTTAIATPGTHSDTLAGELDAFAVTFTNAGVRLFGTYYGGRGQDIGLAAGMTSDGDIVIAGRTGSAFGIATAGVYQEEIGGDYDAFVAMLGPDGKRQWGTYYGGKGNDDAADIAVAPDGDLLVVGSTSSVSGIASVGAHMEAAGGKRDVLVARLSSTGSRRWGRYVGGSEDDEGYAVSADGNGNAVIAGRTGSTTGISSGDGSWARYQGGQSDAFFAMLNPNGRLITGSYYGDFGSDQANDVTVAEDGVVTFVGSVNASRNQLGSFDAHQMEHGDYSPRLTTINDAYVARFRIDPSTSLSEDDRSDWKPVRRCIRAFGPNPAHTDVFLEYDIVDDGMLEVVASDGQIVAFLPVTSQQQSLRVPVASLAAGMYRLLLRTPYMTEQIIVMVIP